MVPATSERGQTSNGCENADALLICAGRYAWLEKEETLSRTLLVLAGRVNKRVARILPHIILSSQAGPGALLCHTMNSAFLFHKGPNTASYNQEAAHLPQELVSPPLVRGVVYGYLFPMLR